MVSLALAAASTILTLLIKEATPNPDLFTVRAPLAEAKAAMAPSKLLKHKHPSKRVLLRPVKAAVVSASHALLVHLKIRLMPEDLPAVVGDGELPELLGLHLERVAAAV